jgi:four helix bundle protein
MKFEDLGVWKKSARLSAEIYKKLGNNKNFSFRDQITRSGLSISSNIAEGFERESKKECLHFLSIARGSCGELRSQIYIGIDINTIERETGYKWIGETKEISKMLTALIKTRKEFISNKQ